MKKLILMAAAVAAIASCAKVETVSTTGPKLISFKSIDAPMTKSADKMPTEMGVNAMWNHGTQTPTREEYFNNAKFTQESTTPVWSGKQYWPKTGTLDFIVYAPFATLATIVYNEDKSSATVTYPMSDASVNILYGEKLYQTESYKDNQNVSVKLKHATAQVIVNAKADETTPADLYKITGITFSNIYLTGNTKVTYTTAKPNEPKVEYENDRTAPLTEVMDKVVTKSNEQFFSKYIMPLGIQHNLIVDYKVKTGDGNYVQADPITFDLRKPSDVKWVVNNKYIFNLTFTSNEIKFEPTVEDWQDPAAVNKDVEPQA